MRLITVAFAKPGDAALRCQLHDGPQCPPFVDAHGVQQRRVMKGDRGNSDPRDTFRVEAIVRHRVPRFLWSIGFIGWVTVTGETHKHVVVNPAT
ncbi:hypothetical protein GCM10027344_35470 [Spelaeicoccus albus]